MLEFLLYFIILLLSIGIICKFSKKKFTKYYLSLFSAINILLISYASLSSKYYAIPIEHTIYFILLVTLFAFGYLLYENKSKQNDKNENKDRKKLEDFLSSKKTRYLVSIILLIIITILLYYLIKFKQLEKIYGIATTRLLKFTLGYLFKTPLEYAFFRYIIESLISIFSIIVSYMIVNKLYKNIIFFEMIISIFLYSEIGRGRFIYFDILVYILFFLLLLHANDLINYLKQNKKSLSVIFTLVILILVVVTLSRLNLSSGDTSILNSIESTIDQAINYFSGPYKMFSEAIKLDYKSQLSNTNTLFFPILASIEELIKLALNFVGCNFTTTNTLISNLTSTPIVIGKNLEMNAFYTGFFNFYLRGGMIGSTVLIFIYGLSLSWIHDILMKNKSVINYFIIALITYPTLMIMLRWEFQSTPFFCSLLMLLFIKLIIES